MIIGKSLTTAELEQEELSLFSLSGNEKTAATKELCDFFLQKGPAAEAEFFTSYFRWFVILTWRRLSEVSRDDMAELVIPRQSMAALALDFDVWMELIWYLNSYTQDDAQMKSVYEKMRDAFFNSGSMIGKDGEKIITQADMIKEIQAIDRQKNDALIMAEFYSKYSSLISKSIPEYDNYFPVPKEKVLRSFVDLVHFFMGVDSSNIFILVDSTIHPEKYEALAARPKVLDSNYLEATESANGEASVPISEPVPVETTGAPTEASLPEATVSTVNTYTTLRDETMKKFSVGADGQFEDIEGVMTFLDTAAVSAGDEKIRELYFFNEETGQFEWNRELLGE